MRIFALATALALSACIVQEAPPYRATMIQDPALARVAPAPPPAAPAPVGETCREFNTPVVIAGRTQEAHGIACLQPDGTWRVQQDIGGQSPQSYVVAQPTYRVYYPPAYRVDPWYYGPPLFLGGVFIGGGWGYRHGHRGWHGAWGR